MRNLTLLIALLLFVTNLSFAQAHSVHWKKCFGGSGPDDLTSIKSAYPGAYVFAGYSGSIDGDVVGIHGTQYDYWVGLLSSSGALIWSKAIGGSGSEIAYSVDYTFDSGLVVTSYSNSADGDVTGNHGTWDYWVAKLSKTGSIDWARSLGGSATDIAEYVIQTSDSGYLVGGGSSSTDGDIIGGHHDSADCWVVKLSKSGSIQWQKSYGGSRGDGVNAMQQTYDGGYIIAGGSNSTDGDLTTNYGGYDVWIIKIAANGDIEWQKTYGGSQDENAGSIIQTSDSGYAFTGFTKSNDTDVSGNKGGVDAWVVKLSKTGIIQWQKCLGGSNADFGKSIIATKDGGYAVCAITFSNDSEITRNVGQSDFWIVKLSATGIIQWHKSMGGTSYDGANSMIQDADSSYVIAGYADSNDSDVVGNHGSGDCWLVKLGGARNYDSVNIVNDIFLHQINIIPNPTSGIITIKGIEKGSVKITSLVGVSLGEFSLTQPISIAGYPSGMYLMQVFDENGRMVKVDRVVKE